MKPAPKIDWTFLVLGTLCLLGAIFIPDVSRPVVALSSFCAGGCLMCFLDTVRERQRALTSGERTP